MSQINRGVPEEPQRGNVGSSKGTNDNPFLTPPEAFVKDPSAYISGGTQIEVARACHWLGSCPSGRSERLVVWALHDHPLIGRAATALSPRPEGIPVRDIPSGKERGCNGVPSPFRRRKGHAARTAAPKPGRWAWLGGGAPIAHPAATR